MLSTINVLPCTARRSEEQVVIAVFVALHNFRSGGFHFGNERFPDSPFFAVVRLHAPLVCSRRKVQQVRRKRCCHHLNHVRKVVCRAFHDVLFRAGRIPAHPVFRPDQVCRRPPSGFYRKRQIGFAQVQRPVCFPELERLSDDERADRFAGRGLNLNRAAESCRASGQHVHAVRLRRRNRERTDRRPLNKGQIADPCRGAGRRFGDIEVQDGVFLHRNDGAVSKRHDSGELAAAQYIQSAAGVDRGFGRGRSGMDRGGSIFQRQTAYHILDKRNVRAIRDLDIAAVFHDRRCGGSVIKKK